MLLVVTEIFSFSIAASRTQNSHGSVATHLRCGGIFSDIRFSPDSDSEIILKIG